MYEEMYVLREQILKMQDDFNAKGSQYPKVLYYIDSNYLIDFQVLRGTRRAGAIVYDFEWNNYVNAVEKYYQLNRISKMYSIANMSNSKIENEKKKYTDTFLGYYNEINNVLSNPNTVSIIEKYGMHPTNTMESIIKYYSTLDFKKMTARTYNDTLMDRLSNESPELKRVSNLGYNEINGGLHIDLYIDGLKTESTILSDNIQRINGMSDEEFKWYLINDMQPTAEELEVLKSKGIELPTTGFLR